MRRSLTVLACVALLAGQACSGTREPAASPPPATTTPANPGSSASPASTPTSASPTTDDSATASQAPPPRPSTPAPSTAGNLTGDVFPTIPGWKTVPGSGDEGRYLPNGTFVHAIDPDQALGDMLAQRCDEPPSDLARPAAALGASWRGSKRQHGTGVALEFATAADARAFLTSYVAGLRTCTPGAGAFDASVLATEPHLVDRRAFHDGNGSWVELGSLRDNVVVLIMLSEAGEPIPDARASALAKQLFG